MASLSDVNVGQEIECPLEKKVKSVDIKDRNDQAKEMLANLTELGLEAEIEFVGPYLRFQKWYITEDPTIDRQNRFQYEIIGFEFKSPISRGSDKQLRAEELRKLYQVIGPAMSSNPEHYKTCSTHVHVSFGREQKVPLDKAQRAVMAAIYFENAIKDAMPENWKENQRWRPYFRSNMWQFQDEANGTFKITMAEVWRRIRACGSIEALCDLVCKDPNWNESSSYRDKRFKCNVYGLKYATIEFRQIPPSRTAEEAADWADVVAAFVAAANAIGPAKLDEAAATGSLEAINVVFGLGGLGLTDRPTKVEHLKMLLAPHGFLDEGFWERRIKARDDLNEFMKGA